MPPIGGKKGCSVELQTFGLGPVRLTVFGCGVQHPNLSTTGFLLLLPLVSLLPDDGEVLVR